MGALPERIPPGRIKLTYEDYEVLPDDGKRYEILDGELFVTPAPVPKHQDVSRNLVHILNNHVMERGLGRIYYAPIDVILANTTIAQPDILFIAKGRESIITERAVEGPPDLLVEIISPSSRRQDRVVKAALYATFGVRHYWIADPVSRTLETYELDGGGYRLAGTHEGAARFRTALFPELEIDLARVWV